MTKRTDIHSPSNFDPAAYAYVGSIYQGPYADQWDQDPEALRAISESGISGNHAKKGTCDHCGARFHYGAVFLHEEAGEAIAVGHICADDAFGCDSRRTYDLKRMKDTAAAIREQAKRNAEIAETLEANPGLEEALQADHYIIEDIARRFQRWGSLSDKQIALVFKIAREEQEREQRQAEREAELVDAPSLEEGRRTIVGTVISCKFKDTPFGCQWKLLVEEDNGNRVYGTSPSAITDGMDGVERGTRVRFDAKVARSNDDRHFGFYSRPTKAQVFPSEVQEIA